MSIDCLPLKLILIKQPLQGKDRFETGERMRIVDGEVPGILSSTALRETVCEICADVKSGRDGAMAAGLEFLRAVAQRAHEFPFSSFEILKHVLRILNAQGNTPPIPTNPDCEIAENGYDWWATYMRRKGLISAPVT